MTSGGFIFRLRPRRRLQSGVEGRSGVCTSVSHYVSMQYCTVMGIISNQSCMCHSSVSQSTSNRKTLIVPDRSPLTSPPLNGASKDARQVTASWCCRRSCCWWFVIRLVRCEGPAPSELRKDDSTWTIWAESNASGSVLVMKSVVRANQDQRRKIINKPEYRTLMSRAQTTQHQRSLQLP